MELTLCGDDSVAHMLFSTQRIQALVGRTLQVNTECYAIRIKGQTALHGVLMKIRDLGLPLLEVKRIPFDSKQLDV